jgi:hypothetical protein
MFVLTVDLLGWGELYVIIVLLIAYNIPEKRVGISSLWYTLPFILGIVGGIISSYYIGKNNRTMNRTLISLGILFTPIIIYTCIFIYNNI